MLLVEVYTIKRYRLTRSSELLGNASDKNAIWLWVRGPVFYQEKLSAAFNHLRFSFFEQPPDAKYSWCARIEESDPSVYKEVNECLRVFQRTLFIENEMDECFALGWHSKPRTAGKPILTALGQWIHMAKPYSMEAHQSVNKQIAWLIVDQMTDFVLKHPLYRHCDAIVSVLPSNMDKPFDLPTYLAQELSDATNIPYLHDALSKRRVTAQMKFCPTLADKLDNINSSISADPAKVRRKRILLVDDIYESGITILETCRQLKASGCQQVLALTATKTLRSKFK